MGRRTLRKLLLALPLGLVLMVVGAVVAAADNSTPTPTPIPLPSASFAPAPPPIPPTARCDSQQNVQKGGTGVNALVALPCLKGQNDGTLFENYPASAYSLHTGSTPGGNIPNDIGNALAGWGFAAITWLGTICAGMLEWTFSLELAGGVNSALKANDAITTVVKSLGDNIYRPLFVLAVVIAGMWVTWHGLLRRRMTVTLESTGWVLLAASVAAFFLAAPTYAVGSLDGLSLGASQLILGTISKADPDISNPANHSVYGADPNVSQYAGLRAAVNRYWQIYVYRPWEVAEFGSIDVAERKAPNSNMTLAESDLDAQRSGDPTRQQQVNTMIEAQLASPSDQAYRNWYEGAQGSQRFALAAIAFIVITIASLLLIAIAGAILLAQLGLVLLTMVAPLFFLVGVHPSTGRRIFLRWGELMLSFALRRVLYAAFLAMVLVFGGIIVAGVADKSWFLAAVLQMALMIAALMYRKPLAAVFSQVGAGKLDPVLGSHRDQVVEWGRLQADRLGERLGIGSARQGLPENTRLNERVGAQWGARQGKGKVVGGAGTAAKVAAAAETGGLGGLALEGGAEIGRKALEAGGQAKQQAEQAAARSVETFVRPDEEAAPSWPKPNQGGSLPQDEVEERAEQRRRLLRDVETDQAGPDRKAKQVDIESRKKDVRDDLPRYDQTLRGRKPRPLIPPHVPATPNVNVTRPNADRKEDE